MKTKIFCDSADIRIIKKYNKKKVVKGFTTNPSLMRLAGAKNYKSYCKKILNICKTKPVSLEVFADDNDQMIKQGIEINKLGRNVYVKLPIVNSKNRFTGKAIKYLNNRNIRLNITSVYTANQTKKILKCINFKTKVIISIFVGRASDAGKDSIPEIIQSIKLAKKYKNVEILWASVREPYNFIQSKKLGCQIITIPPAMITKIEKFGKSFKELTVETVKNFLVDSKKSNFKL